MNGQRIGVYVSYTVMVTYDFFIYLMRGNTALGAVIAVLRVFAVGVDA